MLSRLHLVEVAQGLLTAVVYDLNGFAFYINQLDRHYFGDDGSGHGTYGEGHGHAFVVEFQLHLSDFFLKRR